MNVQHRLDDTLIALADPTRRAILQRLSRGQARVTELAEPFAISLNSVSKHIRLLERADLVRREKQGRDHWLTLNPEPVDEVLQWMNEQRAIWNQRLDALDLHDPLPRRQLTRWRRPGFCAHNAGCTASCT